MDSSSVAAAAAAAFLALCFAKHEAATCPGFLQKEQSRIGAASAVRNELAESNGPAPAVSINLTKLLSLIIFEASFQIGRDSF